MDSTTTLTVGAVIAANAAIFYFLFRPFSSYFKPTGKGGKNPFEKRTAQPPRPLETNKEVRDNVLKEGFTSKIASEKYDVIVIGSGIGGLSTAGLLAKSGKKVLVLEQHDQAGGCCHAFEEKGFSWDVGIHYVNFTKSNIFTTLLEEISDGQIVWEDMDKHFDIVAVGDSANAKLYPHRYPEEEFWKNIKDQFPDAKDQQSIDKYRQLVKEADKSMQMVVMLKAVPLWIARLLVRSGLFSLMSAYPRLSKLSVKDVLDSVTDNARLKTVLNYCFGDYGEVASHAPFVLHATLVSHYMGGASFPRGGASEIAFNIIPTIRRNGGKVVVRAPVKQILVEGGKAVGVSVEKGGSEYKLLADWVVSDAGVINTFTRLLPDNLKGIPEEYRISKPSMSFFSLFVGLDGDKEELGLTSSNTWWFNSDNLEDDLEKYRNSPAEVAAASSPPMLFVSFPSAKDPQGEGKKQGKSTATVIGVANFEWFKQWEHGRVKNRGAEYKALKAKFQERLLEDFHKLFPKTKGRVAYVDLGTPLSNNYYIGATAGEVYGLTHDLPRFSPEVMAELRSTTKVPGLLLAGQDIFTVGFVPALLSGIFPASVILGRNVFGDLINLRKEIRKAK